MRLQQRRSHCEFDSLQSPALRWTPRDLTVSHELPEKNALVDVRIGDLDLEVKQHRSRKLRERSSSLLAASVAFLTSIVVAITVVPVTAGFMAGARMSGPAADVIP